MKKAPTDLTYYLEIEGITVLSWSWDPTVVSCYRFDSILPFLIDVEVSFPMERHPFLWKGLSHNYKQLLI